MPKWLKVISIVYCPVVLFTKLSVLLLYRRVFSPQHWGVFDVIIRLLMIILCLFYTILMFIKIWQCTPTERLWDHSVEKSCVNISTLLNASGMFNITSDVLILLVPVKSVWNLNMDRARKIQVVLVFSVGLM